MMKIHEYLEKNKDLFFFELMDFAKDMGVKKVVVEKDGTAELPFSDNHHVMFTETKLYIRAVQEKNQSKAFPNLPSSTHHKINVQCHLVNQKYLEEYPVLEQLFHKKQEEGEEWLDLNLYAIISEKKEYSYAGVDGVGNFKNAEYTENGKVDVSEKNNAVIESIKNTIDYLYEKVKEVTPSKWEEISQGDNDFKPNINNDLKYGGRY